MLSGRARAITLALGLTVVLALISGAAAAAGGGASAVPVGFVGVNVDGPLYPDTARGVSLATQLSMMERSGIESIRVVFSWASAQPYERWSQVPRARRGEFIDQHGIPTDFAQIDTIVGLAARYGLSVLPTVIYPPSWDVTGAVQTDSFGRPADDAPYAAFLADLVRRYGPGGAFWHAHTGPVIPIRQWQIWNEPNVSLFWPTQPFAATYVALLESASRAIRSVDRNAQVVLAGLPNYSWTALKQIYQIPGARGAFNVVAVHPYTATPSGVITILRYVRQVMDQNGDASKQIIADEISWPSSLGEAVNTMGFDIGVTQAGQAHDVATILPLLAADRRALGLSAFYYYTWASTPHSTRLLFDYAGLLSYVKGRLDTKPAYGAFARAALAIEGCRSKGVLATECEHPVGQS